METTASVLLFRLFSGCLQGCKEHILLLELLLEIGNIVVSFLDEPLVFFLSLSLFLFQFFFKTGDISFESGDDLVLLSILELEFGNLRGHVVRNCFPSLSTSNLVLPLLRNVDSSCHSLVEHAIVTLGISGTYNLCLWVLF